MGFGEAVSTCLGRYVTFSGRARRSEYWYFVLFCVLAAIGTSIVDKILFSSLTFGQGPLRGLASLGLFLPNLAASVRRLHDVNRSGYWILGLYVALLAFLILTVVGLATSRQTGGATLWIVVPGFLLFFAYAIWLFILTLLPGTEDTNRYGPDPLDRTPRDGDMRAAAG